MICLLGGEHNVAAAGVNSRRAVVAWHVGTIAGKAFFCAAIRRNSTHLPYISFVPPVKDDPLPIG
jgi:hypothetical protein